MNKVRIALVGCGGRGIYVTSLFASHPNCEVIALVDRVPSHIDNAMNELKLPSASRYSDIESMLRDAPVDAVFIASDPMEQVDLACYTMEAGKHVCTEVPAAVSLEQCAKLVETVEKTGCKYQLMEQTRYWGFIDAWKGMRERGELGHICMVQGEYVHYCPDWDSWIDLDTNEVYCQVVPPEGKNVIPTWRQQLLADPIYYLPHTMSPLLKVLDDRVTHVSCMGTRKGSYANDPQAWSDIQYALMHTANDTLMVVGAGFSLPNMSRGETDCHWYEVRGSKGTVTSPRNKDDHFTHWAPGMDQPEVMDIGATPLEASEEQAKSYHGGADAIPIDTFIKAIQNDTTPPMDVYKTVEMTAPAIVAAESARQGGVLLEVPNYRKQECTTA